MPDDDRFERQLRGRGWRKAYRLASGECRTPFLVDTLMKAASARVAKPGASTFPIEACTRASGGS
jgi:hypothetical protein